MRRPFPSAVQPRESIRRSMFWKQEAAASNPAGVEVLKRMLRPFGFEVHQIKYDAHFSFHFDYILGLCAPATFPKACSSMESPSSSTTGT